MVSSSTNIFKIEIIDFFDEFGKYFIEQILNCLRLWKTITCDCKKVELIGKILQLNFAIVGFRLESIKRGGDSIETFKPGS